MSLQENKQRMKDNNARMRHFFEQLWVAALVGVQSKSSVE